MAVREATVTDPLGREVGTSGFEARVRQAWAGDSGLGFRIASSLYGLGHDLRDLLYDAGILESRGMSIPVITIGGLTTGGSGKTPISAAVAGWLVEAGRRPAVVTGGIPDEAAVHRMLNPDLIVVDQRDRRQAVQRAIRSGAAIAVLDSGFQHRRVRSDLQVVCIDLRAATLPGRRRLPSGPFRDRWSALDRADAVVVVRREAGPDSPARTAEARALLAEIESAAAGVLGCSCLIRPTGLRAANTAAEGLEPSGEAVAVAGVMWPDSFLDALEELGIEVANRFVFRDHEPYAPQRVDELREAATGGIVCTLKDAVKLGPLLADELPVWYLEEEAVWDSGETQLRRGVLRTAFIRPFERRIDSVQGERT